MILRRGLVFALLLVATMGAAFAAEPSAQSFLNGIYSAYKGRNSKGIRLDNHAAYRRARRELARILSLLSEKTRGEAVKEKKAS